MRDNQYVVFYLEQEAYGVGILKVHEINRLKELRISKVPKVPPYIAGIMNLRGEVVPIVNLRKKIGLPAAPVTKESRIVIVNVLGKIIGLLVDCVYKVVTFEEAEITSPPETVKATCQYINSLGKKNEKTTFLLDIDKLFDCETSWS